MSINLKQFNIIGLHGKFDVRIPINDNRLILIGVNGLGKTTVVNFIYFALTDQWARLLEYEFSMLELVVNDNWIAISKQDIQQKVRSSEIGLRQLQRYSARSPFPSRIVKQFVSHPLYAEYVSASPPHQSNIARLISRDTDLSPAMMQRIAQELPRTAMPDLFADDSESTNISRLVSILKEGGRHKVIYLPTYRRIEQDLKSIFPSADDSELRSLAAVAESSMGSRVKGHIELVQFGMQDVESKINEELQVIQKRTRSQLTSLTGTYLQDIIRNRAGKIPHDLLRSIPDDVIPHVLERVDESTLSAADKVEIAAAIRRVKMDVSNADVRDSYLAYFFSRLLDIYRDLYMSEENIRALVETCNRYLERKRLFYNDKDFSVHIVGDHDALLEWRMLSSGEKQVASLFTHLYLSKEESQIVLIDEPELSLSVPWQKALLPDISRAGNCSLLIAVTHSPFIYANELDPYAVDLGRLISSGGY